MAIRQTRIFVNQSEPADWAETLIGRVVQPLTARGFDHIQAGNALRSTANTLIHPVAG